MLLIDVRSPAEFAHAHLPGSKSLPLFSDEERKVVGTAYKQESRQRAIKLGLEYFGPKMVPMIDQVEKWLNELHQGAEHKREVVLYCWRGGMRSAGVGWLLDLYGFKVSTIKGGYKSYRRWSIAQFSKSYPFSIVGGYTGSGKTALLQQLMQKGEAVVDLEHLASHKGSAFGSINMPPQPSQEMFENKLALALLNAVKMTKQKTNPAIWMEDESQRIGTVNIPGELFRTMRLSPLVFLDIPFEKRLDYIVQDYGKGDIERLAAAISRIEKRLGGLETKNATRLLMDGDISSCFAILLRYYDKWYGKSLDQHRPLVGEKFLALPRPGTDAASNATAVLQTAGMLNREKIN